MDLITQNIDKVFTLLILIAMSLAVRFVLQILGQRWITTLAHTSTIILLPILTFIITNVISGNIALSLGMVGALSIVRFRNPVRSPLELTVYFASITMGIAASVSLLWLLFLGFALSLVVIVITLINYYSKKILKKNFFNSSFSEGNEMSIINIFSKSELTDIEKNPNLKFKNFENGKYEYSLSSQNFHEIKEIENLIKNNKDIYSYNLSN